MRCVIIIIKVIIIIIIVSRSSSMTLYIKRSWKWKTTFEEHLETNVGQNLPPKWREI